jgi:phage tail sheath protein FI
MNPDHSQYIGKKITDSSSRLIRIAMVSDSPYVMLTLSGEYDPRGILTGGQDAIPSSGLDRLIIGRDGEPRERTGIHAMKTIKEISIVAIPGFTTKDAQQALISHCEEMRDRIAILDPEPYLDSEGILNQRDRYDSKFATFYYPWIEVDDPVTHTPVRVPPSGAVAGIFARIDCERGVHKAPANEEIKGATGVVVQIGKSLQDRLNPKGINCIQAFPGRGILVWGARTLSSDPLWKYVNVRRLFSYVEESVAEGTQWAVFEPNDEKLWARLRETISAFLIRVWHDGALQGRKPEEAFFVKCDRSTMCQDDIDSGRVICVIGIAIVKPAEFLIFSITQSSGGSQVNE